MCVNCLNCYNKIIEAIVINRSITDNIFDLSTGNYIRMYCLLKIQKYSESSELLDNSIENVKGNLKTLMDLLLEELEEDEDISSGKYLKEMNRLGLIHKFLEITSGTNSCF